MTSSPITVVTGASGFVGSEITKQLLGAGYTVRATSRSPVKHEHLELLGKVLPGKLEHWTVENNQIEGAYDEVVQGAKYVFHCAAVVGFGSGNEEADKRNIVDPNVNAAISLVSSVAKSKSVKRLVYTSSTVAIRPAGDSPPAQVYTEKDWCDTMTLANPYFVSKRDSEKAAWRVAKETGVDLVTIVPSLIVGPVISSKPHLTVLIIQNILRGKSMAESFPYDVFVDVRDIAKAHVLAAELPHAKGRYIVCHANVTNKREVAQILKEEYPKFSIQEGPDDATPKCFDISRLEELGIRDLIPVKKIILDQARSVVAAGLGPKAPGL